MKRAIWIIVIAGFLGVVVVMNVANKSAENQGRILPDLYIARFDSMFTADVVPEIERAVRPLPGTHETAERNVRGGRVLVS